MLLTIVDRKKNILVIDEELRDNIDKITRSRAHGAFCGLKAKCSISAMLDI